MDLEYHSDAVRLLPAAPKVCDVRSAKIREREQKCGVKLPRSVTELYSLADLDRLVFDSSSQYAVPIEDFAARDTTDQGFLRVADENQGVVSWHVQLHVADDPPVYHNDDNPLFDETDSIVDFARIPWKQEAGSFSAFVFDLFASRFALTYALSADDQPLREPQISHLAQQFHVGPECRLNGRVEHRFYDESSVLKISEGEQDSQWILASTERDSLQNAIRLLCEINNLRQTLIPFSGRHFTDDIWSILAQFGRKRPKPKRRNWWPFR